MNVRGSRLLVAALNVAIVLIFATPLAASGPDPGVSIWENTSHQSTSLTVETLHRVDANLGADPGSLDPALATSSRSADVVTNLFLSLTTTDEAGNVFPRLATSWSVSPDGLTYTFEMRSDVQWVNYVSSIGVTPRGSVMAEDVEFAVKRVCDPRTGSNYAYVDYIIAGCEELNTADLSALSEEEIQLLIAAVGVEALGDFTVQFTLNSPAAYFPTIAGMWVNSPVPEQIIQNHGNLWALPGFIVTNGPYMLAEWIHGHHITLDRNPLYFDVDLVSVQEVYLSMFESADDALEQYRSDLLDTMAPLHPLPGDIELLSELTVTARGCTYYYGFTTTKPPLDDVLVRRALSAAIDRQTLINRVTRGYQIPANSFAPFGIFGSVAHDPEIAPWTLPELMGGTGYTQALTQARQWLADAGYPNGQGFPEITLMHNTSEGHHVIAQAVASDWTDGLGIPVRIEHREWSVYLSLLDNSAPLDEMPHVWRLGWCSDYPDQNNWVHVQFNTDAGANIPRWEALATAPLAPNGMSFNELTVAAQQRIDPEERKALYKMAEKILSEDAAAYAPIYYYSQLDLTKPWLRRTYRPFGGQHFDEWELTHTVAEINHEGGTLTSWDGTATVEIPENLFPSGWPFDPVQLVHLPRGHALAPPIGMATTELAFELLAFDQFGVAVQPTPGQPFTIEMAYEETQLGPVTDEASLALYAWDGSAWILEPSSAVNTAENRLTAALDHFTRWVVLGETKTVFLPIISR